MIDHINAIIDARPDNNPNFDKLKDPVLFKEFCNSFNKVISSIDDFAGEKKIDKLHQYTAALKDLNIENQLRSTTAESFADTVTNGLSGGITENTRFNRFADALRTAKDNLEKCKLIIDNPEFEKVLS